MKQFVVNVVCAFLLLFLSSNGLNAQMIFDTLQLKELEIKVLKADYSSPVKITTIDTLLKQDLNHLDLGELLAAYTPIFIKSYGRGGLATASFRGTSASHTQVLWNDFNINSPMLGQVDLSMIPNSFFDKVELSYGGGSLKKTSGALGGSVNVSNSNGFENKPLFSFEQSLGSFHSYATNAGLNFQNKKFASETRFDFQASKNDFTYLNNAVLPNEEMKQEDADFQNIGFTQQFSYSINPHQVISFTTWNQWNKRNIPAIMTNVESGGDREEYQKDFSSRNMLTLLYHKNNTRWEVKAAYFYEDQHYYLKTTTNDDSAHIVTEIDVKNKTKSFFTKANYELSAGNGFTVSAGLNLAIENVLTSNYLENNGRNTFGGYGSIEKKFRDRLILNLLVRAEFVDDKLLPLMPLFGINYQLLKGEDLYVRASISRNYHLPTLNDLYWNPGGNEDLLPEDGFEMEGGINYAKRINKEIVISLDASVYASRINDWIQWVPTDYRFWAPENINEVFARGLELSLHMNGQSRNFTYKFFAEYAFTKTTNESDIAQEAGRSGQQLIYIPEHTANGFIYGSIKGYYLSWTLNYVGERSTTMNLENSYSGTLPSYLLNDASLGKSWLLKKADIDLRFKVNNIFNVDYQAILWRAMPGRNYEIIINFNIK